MSGSGGPTGESSDAQRAATVLNDADSAPDSGFRRFQHLATQVRHGPVLWVAPLVVLVVLATAALVGTMLVSSRDEALTSAQRDMARWAAVLADTTEAVLSDAALLAASLQNELAERGVRRPEDFTRVGSSREMHEWTREAILLTSSADAISMIDTRGRMVGSSVGYPMTETDFSDRMYFRLLRDQPGLLVVLSDPIRSRITQSDALPLVHRVSGPQGEFLGVISTNIHAARLTRRVAKAFADEPNQFALLRRDGQELLRFPAASGKPERSTTFDEFMRSSLDRAGGGTMRVAQADGEGEPRLVAFRALSAYPLVVSVSQPESVALAPWRAQATWVLGLAGAMAALVVGLGLVLTRHWRVRLQAAEGEQLRQLNAELEDRVERRTRELELARDAAERANRAKSEFLSGMSHELRTPLNAVLGFSQLLEVQNAPRLSAQQLGFVQHIHHAGAHLLELIDEVLDLARIEAQRTTVSLEPLALGPLIESCCTLVRPQADKAGLTLESKLPSADWQVQADRARTRQALLNLLSNAVKYNRPKGTIRVSVRALGASYRIVVQDTGAGLSAEQISRLFVPFERLDAAGGQIQGTGIGLALSKRLVELMAGTMGVDSQPGIGSSFWIELPAAREPASTAMPAPVVRAGTPSAATDRTAQRPWHVLCIEDNPANQQLMRALFGQRDDMRLELAGDANEGLRLARAAPPDLILLDINLPGQDGYSMLRALRAFETTRDIAVIAVSALAMPDDLVRGYAAGFAAYVTKPIDPAQLEQLVSQQLGLIRQH